MRTSAAQYIASRPAGSYKKVYSHLTEQADIAVEVITHFQLPFL